MNAIRFLFQLISAAALTWCFTAFILGRPNILDCDTGGRLGMVIAMIVLFIVVKSFTDPDD